MGILILSSRFFAQFPAAFSFGIVRGLKISWAASRRHSRDRDRSIRVRIANADAIEVDGTRNGYPKGIPDCRRQSSLGGKPTRFLFFL